MDKAEWRAKGMAHAGNASPVQIDPELEFSTAQATINQLSLCASELSLIVECYESALKEIVERARTGEWTGSSSYAFRAMTALKNAAKIYAPSETTDAAA